MGGPTFQSVCLGLGVADSVHDVGGKKVCGGLLFSGKCFEKFAIL